MKVVMIGAGYVGLVTGACFAEFGFQVHCIDKDKKKIDMLQDKKIPIYEPGLDFLIHSGMHAKRLAFTTHMKDAVPFADIIMIAVGTPSKLSDGNADLSYVFKAIEDLAQHLTPYTVIVTKSTVPVGTGDEIVRIIKRCRPDLLEGKDFDVVSNPEFLREGSAIQDFMRPDRVVIGSESEKAQKLMQRLYHPLFLIETPILFTDRATAELIKYAANGFLALKIAYINQIADLCEKVGADAKELAKGIGLDHRIGSKFLNVGPGYGGSCFPKDTQALSAIAQTHQAPCTIIDAVIQANTDRKIRLAKRIVNVFKERGLPKIRKPRLAILGITFKPETDDMRDAASLVIIPELLNNQFDLIIYDPLYHKNNPRLSHLKENVSWFDQVDFAIDTNEAISNADGIVILTEWNEFRGLDLEKVKDLLRPFENAPPVLIDYRNIFKLNDIVGYHYISLGRKDQIIL